MIPVKKIMVTHIGRMSAETKALTLAEAMEACGCGSVFITEKGKYVGIVTERDLVIKVIAERKDPEEVTAKDIMSSPIITIEEDKTIIDANDLMDKHHVRHLGVVDKEGNMIGVVSCRDLLHPVYLGKESW
jgi:CBS domain-containing protein